MRDRLFYAHEAAELVGVTAGTIRKWVHRGHLLSFAIDSSGRHLYLDRHVFEAERATRRRAGRACRLTDGVSVAEHLESYGASLRPERHSTSRDDLPGGAT